MLPLTLFKIKNYPVTVEQCNNQIKQSKKGEYLRVCKPLVFKKAHHTQRWQKWIPLRRWPV